MSEYLLTGITISIAASLVAGGCAGAAKAFYGSHSGSTLRTLVVCENVWVIVVIGAQALQVYLAYRSPGIKDATVIAVVFLLALPSLSWVYGRSESSAAYFLGRSDPTE